MLSAEASDAGGEFSAAVVLSERLRACKRSPEPIHYGAGDRLCVPGPVILLRSTSCRSGLPAPAPKPLKKSDESLDKQAAGGTYHTNAGGMRDDPDHSLVRASRAGAVRE